MSYRGTPWHDMARDAGYKGDEAEAYAGQIADEFERIGREKQEEAVTYEAWRITFQDSEQAARSAYAEMMRLKEDLDCHVDILKQLQRDRDRVRDVLAEVRTARKASAMDPLDAEHYFERIHKAVGHR